MIMLHAVVNTDQLDDGFTWDVVPMWALRYNCFLGDIRFKIDEVDFGTHWGWVPVLDFALGICHLLDAIEPGAERSYEFTESEAVIRFSRAGGFVEVTSSYSVGAAHVGFDELRKAVRDFVRRVGRQLGERHPALIQNEEFLDALRQAGVAPGLFEDLRDDGLR